MVKECEHKIPVLALWILSKKIEKVKPHAFIVNEDGNSLQRKNWAKWLRNRILVLKRTPHGRLPVRSSIALRMNVRMPYRIDLAVLARSARLSGNWLQAGRNDFQEPRLSLMKKRNASSTRRKAIDYGTQMFRQAIERAARMCSVMKIRPEQLLLQDLKIHRNCLSGLK